MMQKDIMTEPIETLTLDNGLILEIHDRSRSIAADTTKVELLIRIPVALDESYFPGTEPYEITKKIFGPAIVFEYRKERSFVSNRDRERVFQELLDAFRADSFAYLSHRDFPCRFALSKYRDIVRNPYQYRAGSEEREGSEE